MPGPFTSYAQPGVYTRTLLGAETASLPGGVRFPVFIGVGSETIPEEIEMIRGSSATVDNKKDKEDVSSQFTGTERFCMVSTFPMVTGNGTGTTTNNPRDVIVEINNKSIGAALVQGDIGKITLDVIPLATDDVKVTYYYNKTDTLTTDDVSDQADGTNKEFIIFNRPIVDGTNGGIITTNIAKVTAKVDSVEVTITDVNGTNGAVTLDSAPAGGTTVEITYYYNQYPNTSDELPVQDVATIQTCGYVAGKPNYIEGTDFVLKDDSIHWGATFITQAGDIHTPGVEYFDDTQITPLLVDNKIYSEEAQGTIDGTNDEFTVQYNMTDGSGRDKETGDISKIKVYVGTSLTAARTAGEVEVKTVYGNDKKIILKSAPAIGRKVYVDYYHNMLGDDLFTLSVLVAGVAGVGTYGVVSRDNGTLSNAIEGTHNVADPDFATEGITWPNSFSDLQTIPGYSISETITITFTSATEYTVTSDQVAGSSGSGELDKTYIDAVTGVRFTIMTGSAVIYAIADELKFVVTQGATFTTGTSPVIDVPGLRVTVANTASIGIGDTAYIYTYDKAGQEPDIGDFYYVNLERNKQAEDYETKLYTNMKELIENHGELNTSNKVVLAAHLAFLNGAVLVAIKQLVREADEVDAASQTYMDAIKTLEKPIAGTFKPSYLEPVTTDETVLEVAKKHCEVMSSIRYRGERQCIFGFPIGTEPEEMKRKAQTYNSENMVCIYPDSAIIGLVDEYGDEVEYVVDGSIVAAAYVGLNVSLAYDVATPMTRKYIVGFKRLGRYEDEITLNEITTGGVTIIEDFDPNMRIRHAVTTNMSNVLTREDNVTKIRHYVQIATRGALDRFIGEKYLDQLNGQVEDALAALFNALKEAEIISQVGSISTSTDESDPTIMRVEATYRPVFGLNWIVVTYTLRSKL